MCARFSVVFLLVVLTGCVAAPLRPMSCPADPDVDALHSLRDYQQAVQGASAETVAAERARLAASAAPGDRLRLAWLLAAAGDAQSLHAAEVELRALLAEGDVAALPWQAPAQILLPGVAQQQVLQQQLADLEAARERQQQQLQQLRDGQRRQDQLAALVEQLQERLSEMQQKLEALRAIELSLPAAPARSAP
ncbi:MAG: hypothetical protein ACK4UT_05010 [Moraxellaceae bacterium]